MKPTIEEMARTCYAVALPLETSLNVPTDWRMCCESTYDSACPRAQRAFQRLVEHAIAHPDSPADAQMVWVKKKIAEGWTYGPVKSKELKQHPKLVGWKELPTNVMWVHRILHGVVQALNRPRVQSYS